MGTGEEVFDELDGILGVGALRFVVGVEGNDFLDSSLGSEVFCFLVVAGDGVKEGVLARGVLCCFVVIKGDDGLEGMLLTEILCLLVGVAGEDVFEGT